MSFFRCLQETAPRYDPELPWPLDGFAYVIMFFCPLSGAAAVGLLVAGPLGLLMGLVVGGFFSAANAFVFDYFVVHLLVRLQYACRRLSARVVTNLVGFAWAIVVSAIPIWLTMWLADQLEIMT